MYNKYRIYGFYGVISLWIYGVEVDGFVGFMSVRHHGLMSLEFTSENFVNYSVIVEVHLVQNLSFAAGYL